MYAQPGYVYVQNTPVVYQPAQPAYVAQPAYYANPQPQYYQAAVPPAAPPPSYPAAQTNYPPSQARLPQPATQQLPAPGPADTTAPPSTNTQKNLCKYCHQQYDPIKMKKVSASNCAIGSVLGIFFVIPGICYCYFTRTQTEVCKYCKKALKEDDYCFDWDDTDKTK